MARHVSKEEMQDEDSRRRLNDQYNDRKMLNSSFSPEKDHGKHKSEKSFAEMVKESTRLPEIQSTLPISMKEIMRNSPKTTGWTPHLPSIPSGQVQLVHRNESKANRKEKRRLKRERKSKGQRKHESSRFVSDEHSEPNVTWKKKIHHRQKKRLLDDGESSLTMPREFRLPTLQEVPKW